jgi:hypothetical protein
VADRVAHHRHRGAARGTRPGGRTPPRPRSRSAGSRARRSRAPPSVPRTPGSPPPAPREVSPPPAAARDPRSSMPYASGLKRDPLAAAGGAGLRVLERELSRTRFQRTRRAPGRQHQREDDQSAVTERTMVGPVGRPSAVALITAPVTPAAAPKAPASTTITPSRSVHCRAAAAGATSIALISTTPTVCRPITIATTSSVVSRTSSRRIGNAERGSELRSKRGA